MPSIEMRSGCWYGDQLFEIEYPDTWTVSVFGKASYGSPLVDKHFFENAIEAFTSRFFSEPGAKTVGIAIDDMTRPTEFRSLIDPLISKFIEMKRNPADIHLFPATGAHRPLNNIDLEKKIGTFALGQVTVHHHSPFLGNREIEISASKKLVQINETFLDCDIKLLLGTVLPHSSVGFSGGLKLVLPGLAGLETIKTLHLSGLQGGYAQEGNELREFIDSIHSNLEPIYGVFQVLSPNRSVCAIFHGDPVVAQKSAVTFLRNHSIVHVSGSYDVGVFNAYPLDTEFVQAGKTMEFGRQAPEVFNPDATLIAHVAASEGAGFHLLRSPGFLAPFDDDWTLAYGGRELAFVSEQISRQMLPSACADKIRLFPNWERAVRYLSDKHGDSPNVAVFPYASIQPLVALGRSIS